MTQKPWCTISNYIFCLFFSCQKIRVVVKKIESRVGSHGPRRSRLITERYGTVRYGVRTTGSLKSTITMTFGRFQVALNEPRVHFVDHKPQDPTNPSTTYSPVQCQP
jgi:hypothetical protein